ncbi:MAG: flagellar biosynthetic protein FliO [Planctomycetota bacterium]
MPAWLNGWLARTLVAMGGVIALIFVTRWVMQLATGRSGALANQLGAGGRAPSGVLSVLGRYPISRGQSLVLLKLDRRILLLSQTDAGFTTLSEVSEAEDVASILLKTSDETGEGIAERFDGLLREAERDPDTARFDEHDLVAFGSRIGDDRPADAAGTLRSRLERYQESHG